MKRVMLKKFIPVVILSCLLLLNFKIAKAQNPTVIAGPILTVNYQITNNKTPTLTGNINSPNASIFVIINKVTFKGVNNGDGSWAAGITNPLDDGSYNVTVAAEADGAHAIMTVSGALVIDTMAPKIAVEELITTDPSPAIQGTTDDNTAMITVNVNGVDYTTVNNNGDGTWTLPAGTISPKLNPGAYKMTVSAEDLAGNKSDVFEVRLIIIDKTQNNLPQPILE